MRVEDAAGRLLLRLPQLRFHQRLLVGAALRAVAGVGLAALLAACGSASPPQAQFSARGAGQADLRLDSSDDGRTVGVAAGGEFTVTLPAPDGGGWILIQPPGSAVASLVSSRFVRALDEGVQVWTFRAIGPGTTTIRMVRERATTPSGRSTFSLIVSVT